MERQEEDHRIRDVQRISITEGIFSQIFGTLAGPGSAFLTRFAIMLNATPLQFGIMSAIGQLSQLFQPAGSLITKGRSQRKSTVLSLQFCSRVTALLYAALPFVLPAGDAINAFLLLFLFSVSLQAVAENIWIGWISDLVPAGVRGRFFSARSQYLMLTAVGTGYAFSVFIDSFAQGGTPPFRAWFPEFFRAGNLGLGFLVIFLTGTLAGLYAITVLSRQPEKMKPIENEGLLRMFLLPVQDADFRKFLLYGCWWAAAVGIGAPFWQPFMMQKLRMSLFEVQLYGSINMVASIAVLRSWGRLVDAYGNRTAMRFIILLGGMNPMVWLFVTPGNHHILYLEAITSGIMWAGAGLVATNFALSIAPQEKRQLYAGVSNSFMGLSMMTTMLLSGALLPQGREIFGLEFEPEQVLFALTGIARWSAQIPLSMVREPASRPAQEALSSFIQKLKRKGRKRP